jgi:flagellar motor switch protein FliN/FliY
MPELIMRIPVTVQVVLGTVRMPIAEIAKLAAGSMVTLDQALGTPVSLLANGREVARGDIFVLDGEEARLGVRITELVGSAAPQRG